MLATLTLYIYKYMYDITYIFLTPFYVIAG